MEGFKIYISSDGYLIIPDLDIKYLIDFRESTIPSMPEASETTVKIAGKDGDVVLNTTYEPMPFEIVCYTEDNLEPEEKIKQENKINSFLNSIKKNTVAFGMEAEEKFYNVKYSGSLTTTRFPKHIKFSIPLKAADPYAKFYLQRKVTGDSSTVAFESSTIKEAGAIFTILGPATSPEIALNDFEMTYNQSVIEGAKLVIDTGNSTITNISPLGMKSNVMPYYNHQFPKIQPGKNELKVQSGISDASQVTLEWYDLKF
jgi:phage-related protein